MHPAGGSIRGRPRQAGRERGLTGERPPQAPPPAKGPEPEAQSEVRGSSTSPRTRPSVTVRNPRVWPFMRDGGGQPMTRGSLLSPDYEFSAERAESRGSPETSIDPQLVSTVLITISPQFAGFFVLLKPKTYLAVHSSEASELRGDDCHPEAPDGAAGDADGPERHAGNPSTGSAPIAARLSIELSASSGVPSSSLNRNPSTA